MESDLKVATSKRHKILEIKDINAIECSCKNDSQKAAYKIYNTTNNQNGIPVIVWNNCAKTLWASMLRHIAEVPLPHPDAITEYEQYIDNFVIPPIKEYLMDFDYSVSEWYNHLDYNKQVEIDGVREILNKPCEYNLFCKREIQLVDSPKDNYNDCGLPKTRAIAGPQPVDKLVLGPVAWAMEAIFSDHFEGYCGGLNWEQLEDKITGYYKEGFEYILQGDGSGFDRTQSHELKYLDRVIYEMVSHNVHHVEKETFLTKATARHRKLTGKYFDGGVTRNVANVTIDATVTSGNPDTTLMNTARMATFCRFMAYKAGVEVKVLAKGDDFVIFYKKESDSVLLKEQFYKYWSEKNKNLGKEYGLGIIIKFITTGTLETFDFCSTHLICDFTRKKFKIVRQWDRIVELGAYSMKALAYSTPQKRQYIFDQAKAMEKWAQNMPFYQEYINFLYKLSDGEKSSKSLAGKDKKIKANDGHRHNHSKGEYNNTISNAGYGRDYNYGIALRRSSTTMEPEVVKSFFREKYGLTPSQFVATGDTLVVIK
jgi:hypothetical protein